MRTASSRSRRDGPVQAAESALTAAVFGDCAFERGAVEIRPIGRNEHELAVGGLPQQKIRQALFTAGANHQVGIGQVRRVEMARDDVRSYVRGLHGASSNQ